MTILRTAAAGHPVFSFSPMNPSSLKPSASNDNWRPVAYVTLQDAELRGRIATALEHSGWVVAQPPTGFHLVQSIADLIEGRRAWLRPSLLVADVYSRGCSGLTLANGLRDLGICLPIVLVARDGDARPTSRPPAHLVDAPLAERMIAELAVVPVRPPAAMEPSSSPSVDLRCAG